MWLGSSKRLARNFQSPANLITFQIVAGNDGQTLLVDLRHTGVTTQRVDLPIQFQQREKMAVRSIRIILFELQPGSIAE